MILKIKKRGNVVFVWHYYGRFLSAKNSKAKPMIIVRIMAMTAGTKYVSTTDAGAAVEAGLVGAGELA
jgi:hypothetical protein